MTGRIGAREALLALVVTAALATTVGAEERPPNVVLIIADDQAWTDYGFMGHPVIRTPHLDRLARESAVFPRGYVPASLCRPSLATIVTGLYPHQHGICGNDPRRRDGEPGWTRRGDPAYLPLLEKLTSRIDRVATLPRLLAARGYRSHQSGKWWEGSYARGGFTAGMTHGVIAKGGRHGDAGLAIGREGLEPVLRFIDECGERPFLVWYAPFLPHTPHDPPGRLLERYRSLTSSAHVARYYAMCEWFDETCGELLAHLDARGLREETLVAFVCDNGWIQSPTRAGYAPRSKRSPYDGGVRTPILLRWPSRVAPGRIDTPVSSVDLAPTILRAAGLEPPEVLRGLDLVALRSGRAPRREAIFGGIFAHDVLDIDRPAASLRFRWCVEERWKLIVPHGGAGRLELFDLETDPFETHDLSGEQPEVVERLRHRLDAWWRPAESAGSAGG